MAERTETKKARRAARPRDAKERPAASDAVAPKGAPRPAPMASARREADESERALGRVVAVGLPAASVVAAVGVGAVAGVGSALLVLAAGALLGAIGLLWASVRTLSGDAPLPTDLELLAAQRRDVDELAEQKRRVLRALKDLESEHALGKIDDADYEDVAARYREEAKSLMRQMDEEVAPRLEEAERVAADYLARRGAPKASGSAADVVAADVAAEPAPASDRRACPSCATSNEADATFCKQCGASMKGSVSADAEKADAAT